MAWDSYDARTFIEDLVLKPPVPLSDGRGLTHKLELALRQYRMSVLETFGPTEAGQEAVWAEMRALLYESRGARESGTRLAVAAAKRIQGGIEHCQEYDDKELRRDADQILSLIRRASPAVVASSSSSSNLDSNLLNSGSVSLAAFRVVLMTPAGPPGSPPPLEVSAAWLALVASTSRAVAFHVWTEMEHAKYGSATLADLARAWAVVAHKAFVASMHGGNAATAALQIDAAKHEIQEFVDIGRVRRGLPRLYASTRPLNERRER